MSSSNYSSILNDYVDELEMKYNDDDIAPEDLLDNLSCKFRTFSSSLDSFILKYTDYPYDINDIDAKKNYLSTKYKNIGYKINPAVIKRWFTTAGPDYTSSGKEKMYALCFALGFNEQTTREFFQKAYFERCFDCHNIVELTYYYCIKNGKSYSHACNLINQLKDVITYISLVSDHTPYHNEVLTATIKDNIDHTNMQDFDFISYIKAHADDFRASRISAKSIYKSLIEDLQGTPEDDILIKTNPDVAYDTSANRPIKALSVLEYYMFNHDKSPKIKIYSDEFLINQIYDNRTNEKKIKSLKLPNSLKSNFPSRHTLNDLRLYFFEGSKPVKNDELRKTIILLFFYKFWCEQFLEINKVNPYDRNQIFIDQINTCLSKCGFEHLYIGNPFDLLFIFSARCEDPLDTFRDIYASLVDEI